MLPRTPRSLVLSTSAGLLLSLAPVTVAATAWAAPVSGVDTPVVRSADAVDGRGCRSLYAPTAPACRVASPTARAAVSAQRSVTPPAPARRVAPTAARAVQTPVKARTAGAAAVAPVKETAPVAAAAPVAPAKVMTTTATAATTPSAPRVPGGPFKRFAGAPKTATPPPTTVAPVAPVAGSIRSLPSETFDGPDGAFVTKSAFWSTPDRGLTENATWFAEDGDLRRVQGTGRTSSPAFRMWTRRTDLSHVTAEMDIRFNGWAGGTDGWHGVNLWLNRTLCTPVPSCGAVNDAGSNSGYALDFMNRDGQLTILKKVPGDTRVAHPEGQIGYTQGGTYYWLAGTRWSPVAGRDYRFAGRARDNGDGSTTLQVVIDGTVRLEVVDSGRIGGPRLKGGRVGLRSDYADITVDDLVIRR